MATKLTIVEGKRVITNLGEIRPDMPEGRPEKFDFEFMKYIWNFSNKPGQINIDKLEKDNKQVIVFKNRRQSKQYIIEILNGRN
ncbi:hypothetical protein [Clostridium estertheticum]|uniref:hypothetical protein n=1 Tax=Clostridium estertheticum TaxID=238834 RepID=UPI001C0DE253|nr:hypothetical protein [Clostridium estertheticum]MBU3183636.1 hypothetical protein [Clostridium estertheticum]